MLPLLCLFTLLFWVAAPRAAEEPPGVAGLTRAEALRLGEQLYRKGLLPSGQPAQAIVQGDTEVEADMFSCESCHMRSGLGSYEGGVLTTPTNGAVLFKAQFNYRQPSPDQLKTIPAYMLPLYQAPPRRPAYTDTTLSVALRDGMDPNGRVLDEVMPRYLLDERDMAILVYYLKSLSPEYSPGVDQNTIRFATVVTDRVPAKEREAMLKPLEKYVRGRNSRAKTVESRAGYGFYAEWMDLIYRRLSLSVWELKGPPETWRSQLEEYYRKEPVFALIGGISHGEWRPVHEFGEEHRIPCLLPATDLPVISQSDWYTLYFSKGHYQEGEAAARFLAAGEQPDRDGELLQIFRDSAEGRASAAGFRESWQKLGRKAPAERMLSAGEAVTVELLEQATLEKRPAVLLLWTGPEALPLLEKVAALSGRPETIFLSASLLQDKIGALPEQLREKSYITYPYALPAGKGGAHRGNGAPLGRERRIAARMNSLGLLLTDSLMMMRGEFYRERFFEVIDMLQDRGHPYSAEFERYSFGPGQRYASKGCYVVQLSPGPGGELLQKSEWVIH